MLMIGWGQLLQNLQAILLDMQSSIFPSAQMCTQWEETAGVWEAFQGVETTSDMAPKNGDNLLPKHRQPAEKLAVKA